ncbi:hypothetical protein OUZ56_028621 [Daphnia magna]|uniref:Uncharacterized protein n=1 Tax=Daphnia magna TaxID=35525 RepID=A0ABR0B4F0_9CRUS|nr:hypothetical protein OUZ56_028621 [Daphnia magna]
MKMMTNSTMVHMHLHPSGRHQDDDDDGRHHHLPRSLPVIEENECYKRKKETRKTQIPDKIIIQKKKNATTCISQAENIYGAYTSAQEIKTIRLTAVVLMYQLYYIQTTEARAWMIFKERNWRVSRAAMKSCSNAIIDTLWPRLPQKRTPRAPKKIGNGSNLTKFESMRSSRENDTRRDKNRKMMQFLM